FSQRYGDSNGRTCDRPHTCCGTFKSATLSYWRGWIEVLGARLKRKAPPPLSWAQSCGGVGAVSSARSIWSLSNVQTLFGHRPVGKGLLQGPSRRGCLFSGMTIGCFKQSLLPHTKDRFSEYRAIWIGGKMSTFSGAVNS